MQSSIYISSEKIVAIGYARMGKRVIIKDQVERDLQEGVMINGKITDHASLVESLISLRQTNPGLFKNPSLIVDGSSILAKRIPAPKLNKFQYYQLVREEFANTAEHLDALVCGYHYIKGAKGNVPAILACATERSQIESYIHAFTEAKIRLKSIRAGVQSILEYVDRMPSLHKETVVLNVIDGITMLSMIFDNGENIFISRTRLDTENRTDMARSIMSSLSGLVQFNKSEKVSDITKSYYLGLENEDWETMEQMAQDMGVSISPLDIYKDSSGTDKLSPAAHFAFFNIMSTSDSIDFVRGLKELKKFEIRKKRGLKLVWFFLAVFAFILLLSPIATLWYKIFTVNREIDAINRYLADEQVIEKSDELDEVIRQTSVYNSLASQYNQLSQDENKKAQVSSQVLDLITTTGENVTVSQFEFNKTIGTIKVNGLAATESDSAKYVEALRKSSLIDSIHYTGYSYNNDGAYNFSIEIKLVLKEDTQ